MIERRFHKFGQRRCSPASVVSSSSSKIYSVDLGCRRCCCCNENGIYLVAINILPLQRCDVTLGLAWSMITSIIRAYKLYQKKRENFVRNLSAIFNTNGARSKNCIFIRNAYRKRFPPIPIEIVRQKISKPGDLPFGGRKDAIPSILELFEKPSRV